VATVNGKCSRTEIDVVDASAFPSSSEKNPTLTIMALALRTADHIADRLKKREI